MKLSEPNLVPSQGGKPSMQEVIGRNFPFYNFVDVDLKAGESAIDDSLDGLDESCSPARISTTRSSAASTSS